MTGSEDVGGLSSELLSLLSQPTPASVPELWKEHALIRDLLDRIEPFQDAPPLYPKDSTRAAALPAFEEWSRREGVKSAGVRISPEGSLGEDQFGLVADAQLAQGTPIIQVPRRAILCWDRAKRSNVLKVALEIDPILSGMANVALAIYLLNERLRGKDSNFHDYIQFLPRDYATPLFFSKAQLELLRGSPTFQTSLNMYRAIARQWAYFHQRLLSGKSNPLAKTALTERNFSFAAYRWAVSTVSTRINLIPSAVQEGESIPALIPVLDLANHQAGALSTDFDPERNLALTTASKDYNPGDPVVMSYGDRSNGEFLVHDGFVPRAMNEADSLTVRLSLSKNDKALAKKRQLLALLLSNPAREEFRLRRLKPIIEEDMINLVRVFVAQEPTLSLALESPNVLLADAANEQSAWQYLKTRLELLERGYSALPEGVSGVERSIGLLLAGERRLLAGAIHYATAKIAAL